MSEKVRNPNQKVTLLSPAHALRGPDQKVGARPAVGQVVHHVLPCALQLRLPQADLVGGNRAQRVHQRRWVLHERGGRRLDPERLPARLPREGAAHRVAQHHGNAASRHGSVDSRGLARVACRDQAEDGARHLAPHARGQGAIVRPGIRRNLPAADANVVRPRDLSGQGVAHSAARLSDREPKDKAKLCLRQREELSHAAAHRGAHAVHVQRPSKVEKVPPDRIHAAGARRGDRGEV